MYFIDTFIFMDKSAYYINVAYHKYFVDFEHIHECFLTVLQQIIYVTHRMMLVVKHVPWMT